MGWTPSVLQAEFGDFLVRTSHSFFSSHSVFKHLVLLFFHFVCFLILKVYIAYTEIKKDTPFFTISVVSDHFLNKE